MGTTVNSWWNSGSRLDSQHPWRLDLVGLLAIIGEAAMRLHVQPLTATPLCLLPRLLPAPQASLDIHRPRCMPAQLSTTVIGLHSGNFQHTLNYFGHLLTPVADLGRHVVVRVTIERTTMPAPTRTGSFASSLLARASWRASQYPASAPAGPSPVRTISARRWGPLPLLSVLSALISAFLVIWTILLRDGPGLAAIALLSITSSMVGLASWWRVDLPVRRSQRVVPPGDVVIQGRQGSFVIVQCDESIAREIYFGKEECRYYLEEGTFKILVGLATFLFMTAVVFMANCTWHIQAAFAVAYILLNGLYWVIALMPARWHWDLSGYSVQTREVHHTTGFTGAIWRAMRVTHSAEWVRRAMVAPRTPAWAAWLEDAENNLHRDDWPAEHRLTEHLKAHT